ncbi:ATP-binding cassette domain-containing protein [Catellatospora citrea]|uniref:ATP-binding cassette domain-containing protein n=1 Tax=Catellatospora citrea TaxID=53366 RepID=UPI00340C1A10
MSVTLIVKDLSFNYSKRAVLSAVNLQIGSGITALVGINGAGKTTLIRNLLGDLTGTGEIAFYDEGGNLRSQKIARARLGYLPQTFGFPPHLSAEEFVSYFAWLRGVPRRDRRAAVNDALQRVNMETEAATLMGQLSGGMLRRIGIAQALVHRPDAVILDEPTVGLDPAQRLDLRGLLAELAEATPVLVSTHLLEDVAQWDAGVIVLHEGTVAFQGTVQDMLDHGDGADTLERAFLTITARSSREKVRQ